MNPFQYQRTADAAGAIQAISPQAKFLAGGTSLIDLMKNGVERPEVLIDLNRIALAALDAAIRVEGRGGTRAIPIGEFHRLPGTTPEIDTDLRPDELVLSIDLPPSRAQGPIGKMRSKSNWRAAPWFAPWRRPGCRMSANGLVAIGDPIPRVDGAAKVTGAAKYSAEFRIPDLAYAAPVMSAIASGTIARMDTAAAERAPGVLAAITPAKRHPPALPGAAAFAAPG
ncbi:MAG TPA: FAD binding domain-containing protein [Bryobacteraceae bacterium]|nr:FAD binding domain-containing protein [Bryobacteraceae bacterium]